MNFLNSIKKITYLMPIRRAARFLCCETLLRNAYYRLFIPNDGKICLACCGLEAKFIVSGAGEMRILEDTVIGSERHLLELLINALQPGDVGYDIGASIGAYTLFLAKRVGECGRVIAFEPECLSYESLQRNLSLNKLKNVSTFQLALGSNKDDGVLHCRNDIGSYSLARLSQRDSGQLVNILPGDEIVSIKNLPLPKVVKIDVEGYEYAVIQGLWETLRKESCRLVCCEIHSELLPARVKPETILELLKELGFGRIKLYDRGNTFHALCYKE